MSERSEFLTQELFSRVLVEPAVEYAADSLLVVSGFVTANMADRHLYVLNIEDRQIDLRLIVGMSKGTGVELAQHMAFKRLANQGAFGSKVYCNYVARGNPIHAKTYIWLKDNHPVIAFAGSANYTLNGFGTSQIETLSTVDSNKALRFYDECLRNTVHCNAIDVEDMVEITETRSVAHDPNVLPAGEYVTLSLLNSRTGDTHKRSGLNWGQREGRERNQAYIPVPMDIARSGFFPEIGEQFTVLTDDGESFIFVRAQQGGKALETTENNSRIGKYIRNRIGVPLGEFVTREHLETYGRTDVNMTRIDEETFLLNFRSNT